MLNDRGEFVFVGNWTAGVGVFVGKPGAPALQTRVLGTNSFELSFSSNPGWSYTLQSRSSLVGSQWQDLETGITGTGGLITLSPSLIGHATSFFRLVAR